MRIALFLPHVGVFGGVRRFVELGNVWTDLGHDVTLHHPDGTAPAWLPFRGRVAPLAAADAPGDLAFCAEPHTFDAFRAHGASQHVYYCVLEKDSGLARAIADPRIRLAANSTPLRRTVARRSGREVWDGIGGLSLDQFRPPQTPRPDGPLRVLVNGRRSRPKKGTDLILRALAGLWGRVPEFETVLFDSIDPNDPRDPRDGAPLPQRSRYVLNPSQDELVGLYQSAHVFIAAERKAGWCNTALEAMACEVPVIASRVGGIPEVVTDGETGFLSEVGNVEKMAEDAARLLQDATLRREMGKRARESAVSRYRTAWRQALRRGPGRAPGSQPRQRDPGLLLVLPRLVLVRRLARLVALEEQHLRDALVGVDLRRQRRRAADSSVTKPSHSGSNGVTLVMIPQRA
jgi:glycosyltransferase involved in cell wall biosynthesis